MFYSSVSDEAARYWGYNPEFAKRVWEKRRAEKALKAKERAAEERRLRAEAAKAALERKAAEQKMSEESRRAAERARITAFTIRDNIRRMTFREVERRACRAFGVSPLELRSNRRQKDIAFARQFVMYWSVRLTGLSLPQIGRLMGGLDHTTVLHGKRTYPVKRAKMGRYLRHVR